MHLEQNLAVAVQLNFQAVIKSAASAASLDLQGSPRAPPSACRGYASSRLDHGLKVYLFFLGRFSIYLAPSGAKYCEKGLAVTSIGEGSLKDPFWNF